MTSRVFKRSLYSLKNKKVWTILFYPPYDNLNSYGGEIIDITVDGEYISYKDYVYVWKENKFNGRFERKIKIHRKYVKWIEII